ncbi:MAG: DUF6067 family protein [Methylococcaceae bacterium]
MKISISFLLLLGLTASASAANIQNKKAVLEKQFNEFTASTNAANIQAIWANDGGDKVTQDELRVSKPNGHAVINTLWDGKKIRLFGAKNEVVNFNLIMEAPSKTASNVAISFNTLTEPGGATIQSSASTANNLFTWVNRPIELFYVRYLQIKGISQMGYQNAYDERHVPKRFQRPWTGEGDTNAYVNADYESTWKDRPDHDKFYPDIAVPLELQKTFDIVAGKNQSIWVDIYIPKTAKPGIYTGTATITEAGADPKNIPVELTVNPFALPDNPSAKTMLYFGEENVNDRYFGRTTISGEQEPSAKLIHDRHFLIAHRHKISLIGDERSLGDGKTLDRPSDNFAARLKGDFFTSKNGYDGPGVAIGNNVYSIETFGDWRRHWGEQTENNMRKHADAWVNWFTKNAADTEYFLYLIDESLDYPLIEKWSQWLKNNPGPGKTLKSMATIALPSAVSDTGSLNIPTSETNHGTSKWEASVKKYANDTNKRFFLYNGFRPNSGVFMTEEDGVGLRVNAWIQFKKHINRWFYWESTYYNDFQGGSGKMNLFQSAHTFGAFKQTDAILGETSSNYANGDGVLFYPGTDTYFPKDSYGIKGPIVSLRLKHWRRGIQDHDYLTLASAIDPNAVQDIVNAMIPKVVWELGTDPKNSLIIHTDISWPINPDAWETARKKLTSIIINAKN